MPNPTFGLVVEGPYDETVYSELVPKLTSPDAIVIVRVCGDVHQLMQRFPAHLRDLEHVHQGQPVDKALVIRDSGGKEPRILEEAMANKIQDVNFRFPKGIQLCVVRRTVETWLLADINAINSVASARGGRPVADVQGTLEDIEHPKEKLKSVLSKAGLFYVQQVCGEIARHAEIRILQYRCPSFVSFHQKVLDC